MSTDNTNDGKSIGSDDYRNKETLQEYYVDREMSIGEVAEYFDVAISTIYTWMQRNDIESRGKGPEKTPVVAFKTELGSGYERWKDKDLGRDTTVRVHQLLAVAKGNDAAEVFSNGAKQVHHRNGIPWDNRFENIELLTDTQHSKKHHQGSSNANSKLTESDVQNIRNRAESGESPESIADTFPVVVDTVERIIQHRAWTHVE